MYFLLFYVFLCCSMYFLCYSMYFCVVLCIFVLFYVFLCCSVYFCVVLCIFVLFYYCLLCVVLCIVCVFMCTELLPPGGYPIAVKYVYHIKYGISAPLRFVTWTRIKLKNENELKN